MKSVDYLYGLLKKHPDEGWYVGKKRYTIGTAVIDGKWKEAVCSCFRDQIGVAGELYDTAEEAWEVFLTVHYPRIMQKWRDLETSKTN